MRVKSEKKRGEIIALAGDLFRSQGYGAVSMATVAAAIGGSKGTLYGYFSSKEELFAAFIVTAGKQRLEEFIAFPEMAEDIESRLTTLGQRYLRFLLSEEIMSVDRLVIAEAARFPELGRIFYENGPKRVIGVISDILSNAAQAGELEINNPVDAAWRFKALCEARLLEQYLWATRSGVTDSEIADNVGTACSLFLEGFRKR